MRGVSILKIIWFWTASTMVWWRAVYNKQLLPSLIFLSVDLLVSQSCLEDDRSHPRRSLLHPESLAYTSILTDPYLECPHWEKMELLHACCSISEVFLLHKPSWGLRASSGPLWSVVGLAGADTISAVPETNGVVLGSPVGIWKLYHPESCLWCTSPQALSGTNRAKAQTSILYRMLDCTDPILQVL